MDTRGTEGTVCIYTCVAYIVHACACVAYMHVHVYDIPITIKLVKSPNIEYTYNLYPKMIYRSFQLLEQGLRAHPGSQADRWDRIAELVGTKTKAECVTRFKVSCAYLLFKSSPLYLIIPEVRYLVSKQTIFRAIFDCAYSLGVRLLWYPCYIRYILCLQELVAKIKAKKTQTS